MTLQKNIVRYDVIDLTAYCEIDIIDKYTEPTKIKQGSKNVLSYKYFAKKNEFIILISKHYYNFKDGYFFIAENKYGERFTVNQNEITVWDLAML